MKRTLIALLGASLVVTAAAGGSFFFVGGGIPIAISGGSSSPALQSTKYACDPPAIVTQYSCDQLPKGYQIATRLLNAPQASCSAKMTESACKLLKQTFGNGVCDPNETPWTDPLDCGCSGAVVSDPYTGRCGSPAVVCQLTGAPVNYNG